MREVQDEYKKVSIFRVPMQLESVFFERLVAIGGRKFVKLRLIGCTFYLNVPVPCNLTYDYTHTQYAARELLGCQPNHR